MNLRPEHRWLDAHQSWAVWGLGASGIAAANLLARHGKHVTISDPRDETQLAEALAKLHPDVRTHFGANTFDGATIVVTSPGLPPRLDVFAQAQAAGIPVISEIELAHDCSVAPWMTITGTDGKTTTTSLVGAILEADGREVCVAGNIGIPLCDVVEQVSAQGVIVAEVSAFQLWTTHHFAPQMACLTNLAGDHLDYFEGDYEAYGDAKRRLIANMTPEQGARVWVNAQDPESRAWQNAFQGAAGEFALTASAWLDPLPDERARAMQEGSSLVYRANASSPAVVFAHEISTLGLQGRHNIMNMLCAGAMCLEFGVAPEIVEQALIAFEGLPHRYERVATIQGVTFIDDSKATNAHAALAGLRGADFEALVVISGGVDKGLDLGEFASFLAERAHAVVLIGELAPRLFKELEAAGFPKAQVHCGDSMEHAVQRAYSLAKPLNADVVLSPASSSFDMFESYAHRGEVFQQVVRELE